MAKFWSWQSCEWSVIREGKPATIHTQIRSVAYADVAETALVKGAGRQVLGTTDPSYTPGEITIEFLTKWLRIFIADITNNGEFFVADLELRMVIKRQARSETEAITDEVDFVITGIDDSGDQGSPDPLVTPVKGQITQIVRNGVKL